MIKGGPDERSTVGALVERLQLSQSTVTELVQRAEDVGLVRRTPSTDDARVVFLSVTDRGEALLEPAVAAHGAERRLLRELVLDLADAD
jgi:DNA-binding MarR family transcriptional regulator